VETFGGEGNGRLEKNLMEERLRLVALLLAGLDFFNPFVRTYQEQYTGWCVDKVQTESYVALASCKLIVDSALFGRELPWRAQ
jgi:hypothetical protein